MKRIKQNELIGGQPFAVVRDLIRREGDYEITPLMIEFHLKRQWVRETADDLLKRGRIDRDHRNYLCRGWQHQHTGEKLHGVRVPSFKAPAKTLFDHLLAEGYIEANGRVTIAGSALGMAKFIPRISRAKAETLLAEFLERVAEANADLDVGYWITEVRVFGSYLTDADDLGDVDIAYSHKARGRTYPPVKRKPSVFAAKYPKGIRNGSPYLSLHDISEIADNPNFVCKTVYTFTPPESDGQRTPAHALKVAGRGW
jgi:hypothetical protein